MPGVGVRVRPASPGRRYRQVGLALAAALAVAGLPAAMAQAGGSAEWRHTGQGAFDKATLDGTVVDSLGRISLAFALDALHQPEKTPFVWCLAVDPKGRVIAGTGNDGRLFAIDPATRKVDLLYDSDELEILSLAVAADGTVYAGSGPKGKVYRIAPDGKADVYYQTGAGYVWALALSAKGDLYAGTGPEGMIYRITGPGVGQALYDSPQTHILSLALDAGGRLYAGSDRAGLIYRIDPAGGVFVLHDAAQREVRALLVEADGTVYAAVMGGGAPTGGGGGAPSGPSRPPSSPGPGPASQPPARPPTRGPTGGGAAVLAIEPTGTVRELFSPKEPAILALARRGRDLLVATGEEARLYAVDLDRPDEVTMLTKVKPRQILALATSPDGACYLGTANPGEVHRLSRDRVGAGTLTGEVLDARFPALWGRLRWRATVPEGTQVTVSARSGNVAEPDDTWSPWSKEAADQPAAAAQAGRPAGDRLAAAPIDAPMARYLQYRLTLSAADRTRTPMVPEVAIGYLPANQPPEVVTIAEAGSTGKPAAPPKPKPGQEPSPPKPANPEASVGLKINWQARDPNGDALRFTLSFRGEDETLWKPLADDLTKPEYVWNVEAVPDGRYRLKVVASDVLANSPERALTGERTSDPIVVDQTAPVVTVLEVVAPEATVRQLRLTAVDGLSDIASAAWSLDGKPWTQAEPVDRIFDDPEETFLITLRGLSPGEHTFVLRVEDSAGNVGAGKTVFEVK